MHYKSDYHLLTLYKFVNVDDPQVEVAEHTAFCQDIWLKGRVYIGPEGMSSTISGTTWQCWSYKQYLQQTRHFADIPDIDVKATKESGHCFDKMIVKYRDEIVSLGVQVTQEQVEQAKQEITPDELKRIIDEEDPHYAILDMRNDYEFKLGHFKGAEPAFTENFREVPSIVDYYKEKYKDKKVVMYCTGGIRCEKLNALLQEEWLDNFYGLEGGVMKYVNTQQDANRLGNLYTFDGRVSMQVGDSDTHTTIGQCIYTSDKTDNCENCRYSECNARLICGRKAYKRHMGFCSSACRDQALDDLLIRNDDRDPMDYKLIRRQVKHGQMTHEQAQQKIAKHVNYRLDGTSFNHQTSLKADECLDRSIIGNMRNASCVV